MAVSENEKEPTMNYNNSHDGDDEEAFLHTFHFSNGALGPVAVNTAIELDIFGIIGRASAQISATEIASQFPKKNPDTASSLDRVLRLLVTNSFLKCSTRTLEDGLLERIYGLAPAAKYLAPDANGGSLSFAFANNKVILDIWGHMKDVLLEGGDQFKKRSGMSFYEHLNKDPTLKEIFDNTMAGFSALTIAKILKVYKGFEGLTSLVDVGGGNGTALNMIVSNYPSIKGINFDLARVIKTAPPYPGIEHVEGDMFVSVPKADAILMQNVLHNWSDQLCLKVLKNCYDVLPVNGKIIIITAKSPEVLDNSVASKCLADLDCIMLLHHSGRERSEKELESLCMASGFSKLHIVCQIYGAWTVVEFHK